MPDHRSRLIFDLDSTVVTVFGHQDGAEVGYNPRYRGKRSYNPLLCMEANSSYLWDAELRRGNAGTWDSTPELLATCFANVPADIREVRLRADAGFGLNPVFDALESHSAEYAVVARMTASLKRSLTGLRYTPVNRDWEMAELQLVLRVGPEPVVSWSPGVCFPPTKGNLRCSPWAVTPIAPGLPISPSPLSAFGISTMHARPSTLASASCWKITRYAKFPPAPSPPIPVLEIIRLAYNLVTAFQRLCLQESWQRLTLSKLRYNKLFLLPGELTRPQNCPVLRLRESSMLQVLADDILRSIHRLPPLNL